MDAKGVVGGVVVGVGALVMVGLRIHRAELRSERYDRQNMQAEADFAEWQPHMLHLMAQAPDQKRIGEYLVWGVNAFHDEVASAHSGNSGTAYRDAMIDRIFAHAYGEGREDIQRSLTKMRTYVKLSDQDTWWELQPQHVGK